MPDPFPKPTENFFTEKNDIGSTEIEDLYHRLTTMRRYDAMVTDVNVNESGNKYELAIHMKGIGYKPTYRKILGINPDPGRQYLKGWPCQVLFDGRIAIMQPYPGPMGLLVANYLIDEDTRKEFPHRVWGWVTDPVGGSYYATDHSGSGEDVVALDYQLSLTWGYRYLVSPAGGAGVDWTISPPSIPDTDINAPIFPLDALSYQHWLCFLWQRPLGVHDRDIREDTFANQSLYVSSGIVLVEELMPVSRQKYQTLTVIDDAKTIGWDWIRFNQT